VVDSCGDFFFAVQSPIQVPLKALDVVFVELQTISGALGISPGCGGIINEHIIELKTDGTVFRL
jgi:hypothetical protein